MKPRALTFCLHFDTTFLDQCLLSKSKQWMLILCFEVWISRCSIPLTAMKVVTGGERSSRGSVRLPTRKTCTGWRSNGWDRPENIQRSLCSMRQGCCWSLEWSILDIWCRRQDWYWGLSTFWKLQPLRCPPDSWSAVFWPRWWARYKVPRPELIRPTF